MEVRLGGCGVGFWRIVGWEEKLWAGVGEGEVEVEVGWLRWGGGWAGCGVGRLWCQAAVVSGCSAVVSKTAVFQPRRTGLSLNIFLTGQLVYSLRRLLESLAARLDLHSSSSP